MRALRVAARRSERSLRTTDRALAWLKQVREEIDPAQGMLAIGELCDRFSATVQHQKPKTVERKSLIIRRIKKHWPTDPLTQITKVKPSHVDVWISRYRFVGPFPQSEGAAITESVLRRQDRFWRLSSSHSRNGKRMFLSRCVCQQ